MLDDLEGSNDLPAVKSFDLGNNKLYLKREDPYGFWHLSLERGALPEAYRGSYTSPTYAEAAAKAYIQDKGKELKPLVS